MEKIQAPEDPGDLLEELPDRSFLRDIARHRVSGGAAGTDGLGHPYGGGDVDVRHHDARALGGQASGAGRPDAVRTTHDDRHLARQSIHV